MTISSIETRSRYGVDAAASLPEAPRRRATSIFLGRRFLTALVVIGAALRLWAYAANTSLFLDEILLARNILGMSLADLLTRPLQLDQVAPRGFLLVEKVAVLAFGPGELALRLFPFLCGVAGVFLFRRLAERALGGYAIPFAVALFAVGVPFITYGAEVKQYEVDATVAILLLVRTLDLRGGSTRRLLLTGAAGFLVIWFSQASVIVMGGIGLALAADWLVTRDRRARRALFVTVPMWAVASLIAVAAGLRSMTPSTREFMNDFWRQGFFPLPFDSFAKLGWFWNQTLSFFSDPTLLEYRLPALFLVVALIGLVALWRTRREVALLLLGPVVVALTAAVAQQYPYRGRLMVYLIPGLLLAVAAGAEWVRGVAGRLHPALGAALMIALLAPPLAALAETPPPYDLEHHRTLLAYLQQHRKPGDVVYVFPLSRIGMLFYGPRYGLQPGDWTTGVCDRNDTRAYVRDVDRYRGVSRLWVLSSMPRPFRVARPAVQQYLSAIGVKRDSLSRRSLTMGSVSLELYDLSDATRLKTANTETFPVAPMPTDPRPGCRPWARPDSAQVVS